MGLSASLAAGGVKSLWGPRKFVCAVDRDDSAVCAFALRVLRRAAVWTGAEVNFTPCAGRQVSQEGCDLQPNVRWVLLPSRGGARCGARTQGRKLIYSSPCEGGGSGPKQIAVSRIAPVAVDAARHG